MTLYNPTTQTVLNSDCHGVTVVVRSSSARDPYRVENKEGTNNYRLPFLHPLEISFASVGVAKLKVDFRSYENLKCWLKFVLR